MDASGEIAPRFGAALHCGAASINQNCIASDQIRSRRRQKQQPLNHRDPLPEAPQGNLRQHGSPLAGSPETCAPGGARITLGKTTLHWIMCGPTRRSSPSSARHGQVPLSILAIACRLVSTWPPRYSGGSGSRWKNGASDRSRTCNLLIRSQKLYPIELRMLVVLRDRDGIASGQGPITIRPHRRRLSLPDSSPVEKLESEANSNASVFAAFFLALYVYFVRYIPYAR